MTATMAKKKPKSADRHKQPVLSFRPTPRLREVLKALKESERRSISQLIQILLEEALTSRELWVPGEE